MYSLANAILEGDFQTVRQLLGFGMDVNQLDEYGFTPLIEAAIIDNIKMVELLLSYGANPNQQDATGGTALHWAAENNNLALTTLLLTHRADPNAYTLAGQPVLVMPMLRQQNQLKKLLIKSGADQVFAQDFINVKLLGHIYELVGTAEILSPTLQFVEVDFEGFFLEVTIGLIANSLAEFQNHFAARQLRRYSGIAQFIVEIMRRASVLIKYQQYRVDITKVQDQIDTLLNQEPVLIPIGYEGHAITFLKYADTWVKCDRREDSRLYDNVMFYRITKPKVLTPQFFKDLLYKKHDDAFINTELDRLLGLEPITELKVEAQISGNCSWANVEAAIPAIFFLVMMKLQPESQSLAYYKTLALNFFHRWREWNKARAVNYCIQSYEESNSVRKATKAEILAAILFQRSHLNDAKDRERIDQIMHLLLKSPYQYLLKNYVLVYYFENPTEEGKQFYQLLRQYDYSIKS